MFYLFALRAVLFLNQAMVEDANNGLVYSLSDRLEGRVNLSELYEAHIERNREDRRRDIMIYLQGG